MWNPFKRRKNRKQLRELGLISKQFALVGELARRGLIYWKAQDKILLLEESLATIKLAEGKEGFQHFLDQVAAWQNFQLINEAYEAHRIKVETEAVRKAQKDNPNLSNSDIYRIRQFARSTMGEIDIESLDILKEFDIMIIRPSAPSAKAATEANGQLLAVGHYDGKQVEMAMYDDIKNTVMQTGE